MLAPYSMPNSYELGRLLNTSPQDWHVLTSNLETSVAFSQQEEQLVRKTRIGIS